MRREANSLMLGMINNINKETSEQENKSIWLISATFVLIVFASLE